MIPVRASVPLFPAVLFLVLGVFSSAFAQSNVPDVSEFTLVLKTSKDEVELACTMGCAWKQLTFRAKVGDAPQAIDQYGMAPRSGEQAERAGFVLTIKRTRDGVRLEGVNGTAWKTLSFGPVPERGQAIDQNGMTTLAGRQTRTTTSCFHGGAVSPSAADPLPLGPAAERY